MLLFLPPQIRVGASILRPTCWKKSGSLVFEALLFLFTSKFLLPDWGLLFFSKLLFRFFHAVRLIRTSSFLGSLDRIIQELQQMQLDASKVKSRTDLSLGLRNIALDRGFRISDNQGLGNCMFYALSEQLEIVKGIKIPHGELRQTLVQYLRNNPKLVSWC